MSENGLNQDLKTKIRCLHEIYLASILGIIIVYLATLRIGSSSEVNSYISFAATLSSLILAVIAIFLTVRSNSDFSNFTTVATGTNLSLEKSAATLASKSDEMAASSSQFKAEVNVLGKLVSEMGQKIETGLEQIKAQAPMSISNTVDNSKSDSAPTLSFSTQYFLGSCSISGLVILLAAFSFKEKSKPLNRAAFCSNVGVLTSDYVHGFLVSCNSSQVLDMTSDDASRYFTEIRVKKDHVEHALLESVAARRRQGNDETANVVDGIIERMNTYLSSM